VQRPDRAELKTPLLPAITIPSAGKKIFRTHTKP
jgi:hypothetical protein